MKERLENMSPIGFDLNGNVLLKNEDYHWLLNQAEKTQKYREALEFYADEKSWMNRKVTILMDGEPIDVEDCPAIFDDGGNIARKALEGDDNE